MHLVNTFSNKAKRQARCWAPLHDLRPVWVVAINVRPKLLIIRKHYRQDPTDNVLSF